MTEKTGSVPNITTSSTSTGRQFALERELAQLTRINSTVANLIQTIKFTNTSVDKMNDSSNNTHILLDQWIRILSQTNYTNSIIDNRNWHGIESNKEVEDENNEDGYELRLRYERDLLEQLKDIEGDNAKLRDRIEKRDDERTKIEKRSKEIGDRRRRELGLYRWWYVSEEQSRIERCLKKYYWFSECEFAGLVVTIQEDYKGI